MRTPLDTRWYRRLFSRGLDFVYPSICGLCSSELKGKRYLCDDCSAQLPLVEEPMCAQCGECFDGQIDGTFTCPNCHKITFDFEFARAALRDSQITLKLVHEYKYLRQIHLSHDIARLTAIALEDPRFSPYLESGILVPVPLHWRRYKRRQFNQSEEIALSITQLRPELKTINALKRNRYTETQTRLSRSMRLKNLKGAFSVNKRQQQEITDQHIILVDDVFTTGSTANECSKTLLQAGASSVAVLTLLRG